MTDPGEKRNVQTCIRCRVEKSRTQRCFKRLPRSTTEYEPICKACKAEEQAELDKKKLEERRMARERKKQERSLTKAVATARRGTRKHEAKLRKARNAAEQELASRELARRRLINFTKRFNDKYDAGWVHKLICAKLEKFSRDVVDKKSPRLMIFMPPRAGKSELASRNFPAWHLGHNPDHEIIASSYAVTLPMGFSRKIKGMLADKAYTSVFGKTKLDPNSQATEGWLTTDGGGYVAAGVGSGIAGKGAHILIIDDPVKDAEDADSEQQRQKAWTWWDSAAETRLAPGGGVLVIQTRWHDDDLAGRMLRQMTEAKKELEEETVELEGMERRREISDSAYKQELKRLANYREEITNWEVIVFPAVANEDEWLDTKSLTMYSGHEVKKLIPEDVYTEFVTHRNKQVGQGLTHRDHKQHNGYRLLRVKDEALHPARYGELYYRKKKRNSQPRYWSALYQQNPVPDEGVYFRKDMFRYEPIVADYRLMKVYIAWDLAIGQRQANDWTVGLVGAHDFDDRIHLLNMVRVKTDKLAELIMDTAGGYKETLQLVGLERGQIQMAIMPNLEREMQKRRHYITLDDSLRPITDKLARARPAQGWMQQGRILLPQNQPWVEVLTQELLRFPGGLHDDIVDAVAWLVRMVMAQQPPQRSRQQKVKSWKDKLNSRLRSQAHSGSGAMSA